VRREVADDMHNSACGFKTVVWPRVNVLLGGGELVPVESVTADQFARQLDQIAGIDAWIVQGGTYMFGLASRVQWVSRGPFNTFTVRMRRPNGVPTEYEKRKAQIATSGALYPKWTCQAFLAKADSEFLTAAIASTDDVIRAVGMRIGRPGTAPDGVQFWIVPWGDLVRAGCRSLRYVGPKGVWPPAQDVR
jgi:hypothetical protein